MINDPTDRHPAEQASPYRQSSWSGSWGVAVTLQVQPVKGQLFGESTVPQAVVCTSLVG